MQQHHVDLLLVPLQRLLDDVRVVSKRCESDLAAVAKAAAKLRESDKAKDPVVVRAALDKLRAKVLEVRAYNEAALKTRRFVLDALAHRVEPVTTTQSGDSKRARTENRRAEHDLIVNYLLRTGCVDTAACFTREARLHPGYQIEIDAVTAMKRLSNALLLGGSVEPALEWCADNKVALKRMNSRLELDLLLRQMLLLVEAKDALGAVAFARKNLSASHDDHQTRRCMATLAFAGPLENTPYADLCSTQAWPQLARRLEQEFMKVAGFGPHALFELCLRLGLAVCKTHMCGSAGSRASSKCPCCQPHLCDIAQTLPKNKLERSSLICRITGEPMDDVLAMPNGQCYSRAGLESCAQADGRVQCPVTRDVFALSECRKAYFL